MQTLFFHKLLWFVCDVEKNCNDKHWFITLHEIHSYLSHFKSFIVRMSEIEETTKIGQTTTYYRNNSYALLMQHYHCGKRSDLMPKKIIPFHKTAFTAAKMKNKMLKQKHIHKHLPDGVKLTFREENVPRLSDNVDWDFDQCHRYGAWWWQETTIVAVSSQCMQQHWPSDMKNWGIRHVRSSSITKYAK